MKKFKNILHSITSIKLFGFKAEVKPRPKPAYLFNDIFNKRITDNGQFRKSLLVLVMIVCGASMWMIKVNAQQSVDTQESIAKKIIRFHVIANSDSDKDQALKLMVKDQLVKSLSPKLSNANSITDARAVISENLDYIKKTAESTIQENGYNYNVRVTLENCYFPLKIYGNCSFPPGVYEALRVRIGAAEGKNWWCVMFPPLCFVDETYSVVDSKTDKKLKHLLTEDEYDTLVHKKKHIKVKFKIWEQIKKLFKKNK